MGDVAGETVPLLAGVILRGEARHRTGSRPPLMARPRDPSDARMGGPDRDPSADGGRIGGLAGFRRVAVRSGFSPTSGPSPAFECGCRALPAIPPAPGRCSSGSPEDVPVRSARSMRGPATGPRIPRWSSCTARTLPTGSGSAGLGAGRRRSGCPSRLGRSSSHTVRMDWRLHVPEPGPFPSMFGDGRRFGALSSYSPPKVLW